MDLARFSEIPHYTATSHPCYSSPFIGTEEEAEILAALAVTRRWQWQYNHLRDRLTACRVSAHWRAHWAAEEAGQFGYLPKSLAAN